MSVKEIMEELREMRDAMIKFDMALYGFAEKYNIVPLEVPEDPFSEYHEIVERSATEIGTLDDYPRLFFFRFPAVFNGQPFKKVNFEFFTPDEMQAIEANVGRKLDRFDVIEVNRPNPDGIPQMLILGRFVRLGDILVSKIEKILDEIVETNIEI